MNDAASWVQAIGAIAAIGAAFWIGSAQIRATNRIAAGRQASLENAAALFITHAAGVVAATVEVVMTGAVLKDPISFRQNEERFTEALASAANFPAWELEDYKLAFLFQVTVTRLSRARSYVGSTADVVPGAAALPSRVAMIWRTVGDEMNECVTKIPARVRLRLNL